VVEVKAVKIALIIDVSRTVVFVIVINDF